MKEKMTAEKAQEMLGQGFHCSQVVFAQEASRFGIDEKDARQIASGLGGGCFHGEVCGTVSAGVMALSLAYGYNEAGQTEQNARMIEKLHEFEDKFKEKNGTVVCRELIGYDFGKPEGPDNKFTDKTVSGCGKYCADACEILDEMLEKDFPQK